MILIADSGSSKTDWALVDGSGGVRYFETQGLNPVIMKDEAMARAIADDLDIPGISDGLERVFFYGSGCRDSQRARMEGLLKSLFGADTAVVATTDLLGAARALCGREEGIACILGTGSNSCLYDGDRILSNTPSLGYILGDEGGGVAIGKRLVNALYKSELPAELLRTFESETRQNLDIIINRVYSHALANRYLASFTRFVAAHKDVAELNAMLVECFREFFRKNILRYGRRDLKVGIVGGLVDVFSEEIAAAAALEDIRLGRQMKSPIKGLVDFHNM